MELLAAILILGGTAGICWVLYGRGSGPTRCIGCGKCAEICPGRTIRVQGGKAHISRAGCIRCFCCHEMCPAKAIDVKRAGIFNL